MAKDNVCTWPGLFHAKVSKYNTHLQLDDKVNKGKRAYDKFAKMISDGSINCAKQRPNFCANDLFSLILLLPSLLVLRWTYLWVGELFFFSPDFNIFFIPCHTKSGRVLCYTLQTLSVRPSVIRPSISTSFPCSNFSTFWPIFFKFCIDTSIGEEWYWIAWANFVLKQHSYGPWCMSKMFCASFPCSNLSTFLPIFFKLGIELVSERSGMGLQVG